MVINEVTALELSRLIREHKATPCSSGGQVLPWCQCITEDEDGSVMIWYNTPDNSTHLSVI